MVKPEWGTKRSCMVCSTRFYDLNKKPITCVKCGAVVELSTRGKRGKADKTKDLEAEALLAVDAAFSDVDSIVDDALMDDEAGLDEALDDIELDENH